MKKTCTLCKQELDTSNFAKRNEGFQSRCRACHSLYTRKHYAENKDYYMKKARRNGKKYAANIDEYKSSTPCLDCGNIFPAECMDFDHVTGKKEFSIGTKKSYGFSPIMLKEIEKCELVCANCHRIRTRKRLNN